MTEDTKAPGASAVFLYREDVTDQVSRSRTFYVRIKVLNEKGREMANVEVPDAPWKGAVEVQGRTIHKDGTIALLTDAPTEIPGGGQSSKLVFSLPSVEVGSILEYRVTIRTALFPDDPVWMLQQPLFVHKAHYAYRTLGVAQMSYISRIGTTAKVVDDKKGTYSLNMTDIPALPDDDWMPPLNTFRWSVSFFVSHFSTSEAFWEKTEKDWAEFVREFSKPTGELKEAVAGMISPTDTETQKAEKIYRAVMNLENTDFTRQRSKAERKQEKIKDIHGAQDVWRERGGSSNDIALLYVALCRAAGLTMNPMRVVNRNRALFDAALLSTKQFDDYIAVGQLDGKEVFLDPGEKMCPFGMLDWTHTATSGFRLADKSATISRTPAGGSNSSSVQRIADLAIEDSGNVQGTIRFILNGQDALLWRQISVVSDEEEVKKLFTVWVNRHLPEDIHCSFGHFVGLDQYDTVLIGFMTVNGSLGTTTGRRMFLPGLFFESRTRQPFTAQEKRTVPVDVQYARATEDDVTFHPPTGFKVESSPSTNKVNWADKANFSITSMQDGDAVNVTRSLNCNFTFVAADAYSDLRAFYQKLSEADQQQVVLVRNASIQ